MCSAAIKGLNPTHADPRTAFCTTVQYHKQVANRRQAFADASLLRLKTYVASAPPLAAKGGVLPVQLRCWVRIVFGFHFT